MRFHRQGYTILATIGSILLIILLVIKFLAPLVFFFFLALAIAFYILVLQFFRNPVRIIPHPDDTLVYAPADGKVVVIEEAEESEYFKGRRLQVSIFMSPLNVHVNRNPISGKVQYFQYHPGKYLVAWHPKSSTENERTTVVIQNGGVEILIRQIAGAVARRIHNYLQVGQQVEQGGEMGFITFGSRVDLFLPLDAEMKVQIGDTVKGNLSVIAALK